MTNLVPDHARNSRSPIPRATGLEDAPAGGESENGLEPINLKESLTVLRRHLWLILAIASAVVAFTAYRLHATKLVYQATAVIRLVDARRALAGNLDNPATQQMAGSWTDPIQSQLQVLLSRRVAASVVDSQALGLRVQVKGFPAAVLRDVAVEPTAPLDSIQLRFGATGVTVLDDGRQAVAAYGALINVGGIHFRVIDRPLNAESGELYLISRDAAIYLVAGGLHAHPRDRTDVVDVSYTASDPYIAQQVVDAAVVAYQAINAKSAQQQSHRRRIFVQEQLHQTDSLLAEAQNRLSAFRSAKQVYGSQEMISAEQTGLLDLDVKRQELSADRQVYQSLLAGIHSPHSKARERSLSALVASPGVADNPVVQALYQQLAAYQATLDSLSTGPWASAPTNPDVQKLQTLVATTEERLVDAVQSQITSLDARITALDDLREQNAEALKRLPAAQAGEARLVEQVDATRRMADQLREEYQKARIAEAVEAGEVEIIDLAAAPFAPVGVGRRVKLLAGVIVGLLLGAGGAFLVERLNTAIRRREEIESVLQIPGLAIIPQIASRTAAARRLRMGTFSLPLPMPAWPGMRAKSRDYGSLVTISDGRSGTAEAFRTLRTSLIFSQAVQSLRTIVVTSPSPQDGKTTTAANLAITFAQQGMRVALLDCDLRRARLHTLLKLRREPGLTHLMLRQATLEQVVQRTAVDGLSFIAAGAIPPNPSELLGGPQMRSVLETLGREFDVLLLDTPPVHAAADALILGRLADGVLLVVRAGHTQRDSAQEALHRLSTVGARVVGAVLNDPDHKVPQYGGYYYYDYYGAADSETEHA